MGRKVFSKVWMDAAGDAAGDRKGRRHERVGSRDRGQQSQFHLDVCLH